MLSRLRRLHNDQRGISAIVVAVSMIALIGAAVLSVDSGNIRSTRRSIITGTDASVLDAAQAFNSGMFNACEAATSGSGAWNAANQHATDVLHLNHPRGEHDLTDPIQFKVDLYDPTQCGVAGGYTPGKAYYEGRVEAQGFFSGIFGFGNTKPVSTSTAAWGYIQSIGEGLRPFSVCEGDRQFTDYLTYWQALHDNDAFNDASATAAYDALYGSDNGTIAGGLPADQDPSDGVTPNEMTRDGHAAYGLYPTKSMGYPPGEASGNPADKANPNFGKTYTSPAASTTAAVYHPVVRVVTPDPTSTCGYANGNRGWVDLRGAGDTGTVGSSDLREWLLNGYQGEVSLDGPDCDPTEDGSPEACGAAPGDRNRLMEALHTITCDAATPARSCQYVFPILVVDCIGRHDPISGACIHDSSTGGENAEYAHTAFIFIVLRGFGKVADSGTFDECNPSDCSGERKKGVLALDMEFVDVQTSGEVGAAPPPGAPIYQTGTQLCGADHDAENHCPF